ncbi:Uncharacterised protein [Rikenella microfusus]|uniref:Uncharacterized protein n=1 Tax=Rikenella microfusus TaxID=28139 RepID=A0A379MQK1_9BACT|nr:Uncharacterised protein [Rikenella microfusus]
MRFFRIAGFRAQAAFAASGGGRKADIMVLNLRLRLNFRVSGRVGRLMRAGHLLFCATKKVSKKVAGNAIPRSRLPSERKIAHSRVSSLYPYFDTNVRSREYFLIVWFISMFFLCQAGATPGGSLQRRGACFGSAGSGRRLFATTVKQSLGNRRQAFRIPAA